MRARGVFGILLFLLPALAAGQAVDDPLLWPEPQRAFLQDGPGLLLTHEQRRDLLALDAAGRDAFIRRFLADPVPGTPVNELAEGIERRRRLAFSDLTPLDARAQLVFLLGQPTQKQVLDCASTFHPLEIWTYGVPPAARQIILYRPEAGGPFQVWLPIDSKRALYTRDMAVWVEQWFAAGMGGKRIDRRFCPQSAVVDALTGIDGLRSRAADRREAPDESSYRWIAPDERASEIGRPADLTAWAREAAALQLPAEPPRLAVDTVDLDFPDRRDERMVTRVLLGLRTAGLEGGVTAATDEGKPKARLTVAVSIEREGVVFDDFRVRYRLPLPEAGAQLALLLERALRPDQAFLLRLQIRDEVSGAEARIVRAFFVPARPEARIASHAALGAARGEEVLPKIGGRDSVLLVPPTDEVMLGTWRAEAVVSGDRIAKVVFLVDGEAQFSRTKPPYSAEVRLSSFPREQVVRVEGYGADGELISADQATVNLTRGAFRITVTEPAERAKIGRRVLARAEVTVPDDHRVESVEMKVNDVLVATLTSPPWQAEIDVPDEPIVHLAVAAQLDDGRRTEAVRFLRAPENLEQVEVNLVELYTAVTDGSGSLIRGLTAQDFQILEAGRPQEIARFELVENLPLTLGFAIDTSVSMAASLSEAQRAAEGFLHKLQPRDSAFAVGFSSRPYLIMPPTDDLEAVSASLEGLGATGRTSIYDALITSLYYFRGYRGQRALVLLTDGEDTSSNTPWETALEYARRSGVAIYTVGLNVPALAMEVRGHLSELAEATGGRVFYVDRADELATVYGEIEHELRSRYYLAFNSDRSPDDPSYRPVEVKVKRGKARTMRGYYP